MTTVYTIVNEPKVRAPKTRNDTIADVTQAGNLSVTTNAKVNINSSTEENSTVMNSKLNLYTDNDYEDINHKTIVLGVISAIMIAILAAIASTTLLKRRKHRTNDIHLSSQYEYTALLE